MQAIRYHPIISLALLALPLEGVFCQYVDIPDDPSPGYMSLVAGGSPSFEGGPALTAYVSDAGYALEIDQAGRIYYADRTTIYRVETDGTLSVFVTLPNADDEVTENLIGDFVIAGDHLYLHSFLTGDILAKKLNGGAISKVAVPPGDGDGGLVLIAVDSASRVYINEGNATYRTSPGNLVPEVFIVDPIDHVSDIIVDPADDSLILAGLDENEDGSTETKIIRVNAQTAQSSLLFSHPLSPDFGQIASIDIEPDGDLAFLDSCAPLGSTLRSLDLGSGMTTHLAGTGCESSVGGSSGDGGSALAAEISALRFAVSSEGKYYLLSYAWWIHSAATIRLVDVARDLISAVAGQTGFLGCASPVDSELRYASGLEIDQNNILYIQAGSAILAIDPMRELLFTVAGTYSCWRPSPKP